MRFCSILAISVMSAALAMADEPGQELDPEIRYLAELRRLDQEYVEGMRQLAANAASIRIDRLGESRGLPDPFESPQNDDVFRYPDHRGEDQSYKILETFPSVKERELIERWAAALLPDRSGQLLLHTFEPTFGVRFFDDRGGSVYATTLSPKFVAAGIEFPRYVRAINIRPNEVKVLIEAARLPMTESKPEQGAADSTATPPESMSEGEPSSKPDPEVLCE